jgi:hypothetical protein
VHAGKVDGHGEGLCIGGEIGSGKDTQHGLCSNIRCDEKGSNAERGNARKKGRLGCWKQIKQVIKCENPLDKNIQMMIIIV